MFHLAWCMVITFQVYYCCVLLFPWVILPLQSYESTRVDEGRQMLNYSRDKKEGTYRGGEGEEGPAM